MRSNLPGQQAAPTPLLYTPPAAPQSHPVEQTSQQRPAPAPQLLYTPPPAARPQAPRRTVQTPQPRLMASRQGGPPVFSRVSARMVQSAGDLALLRWVNGSSSPASIQYVQGEGATVVSVEVNGRTLFSSTPGEARVRFDAGMPAVPPQGEVRVMVRRVSLSSAPGAELGLFSSTAFAIPYTGADSSAPSLPVPAPTSEPKPNWSHIAIAAAAGASVASFLTYAVMQRSVRALKDQRDRARANQWRSMAHMIGQRMEDSAKDGTLFRDRSGPR